MAESSLRGDVQTAAGGARNGESAPNGASPASTLGADQTSSAADTWTANWRATFFLVPSAAALLIVVLYVAPWEQTWLKWVSANAILIGAGLALLFWLTTARWLTRLVAVHADPR